MWLFSSKEEITIRFNTEFAFCVSSQEKNKYVSKLDLICDVRVGALPEEDGEEGVVAGPRGQVQHRVARPAVGHVQRASPVQQHLTD